MARTADVLAAFAARTRPLRGSSCRCEPLPSGHGMALYSYQTPVATIDTSGYCVVDGSYYSRTTSRLTRALADELRLNSAAVSRPQVLTRSEFREHAAQLGLSLAAAR